MKSFFTLFITMLIATTLSAQVTVTFNIDLNGVSGFDAEIHEVYFSGEPIGTLTAFWPTPGSEASYQMFDNNADGIYTIEASNVEDGTYEFKYVFLESGTTGWTNESIGYPYNHSVTVSSSNLVVYNQWGTLENIPTQQLDTEYYEDWSDYTSQWVTAGKVEHTYNTSGYHTQEIFYEYYDNQWELYEKTEYEYNNEGNPVLMTSYWWSDNNNQWAESGKIEFSYDYNGHLIQKIHYQRSNDQWHNSKKYEYINDSNGNTTQETYYSWNGNVWESSWKSTYEYNTSGYLIQELWGWYDNTWEPSWMAEYHYSGSYRTHLIVYDGSPGQWNIGYKYEYTRDAYSNITQETGYYYDDGQWSYDEKQEYTYDNSYSFSDLILPNFTDDGIFEDETDITIFFNHMLLSASYADYYSNNWENEYRVLYEYSEINVSDINEVETEKINLYPNPVSEQLNIVLSDNNNSAVFELFDTQGRNVISKKISNNEQINLNFLNTGLYFYKLYIKDEVQTGKLMKE
jgi:hypothetical protein